MAKAPKQAGTTGVEITYTPRDAGDPPFATWNGHRFEANVPRAVTNPDMIELARGNPWFRVTGEPQAKRVESRRGPVPPAGSGIEIDEVDPTDLDKMVEVEE